MTRILTILSMLWTVLLITSPASSAWQEPEGFRQFAWGTSCATIEATLKPALKKWNEDAAAITKKLFGLDAQGHETKASLPGSRERAMKVFDEGYRSMHCEKDGNGQTCTVPRD